MKTLILLLLTALSLGAQPILRIGLTNEFAVGPWGGLVDRGPASFRTYSVPALPVLIFTGELSPAGPPIRRVMEFTLQVANTGSDHFDPGNFPLTMSGGYLALAGFASVSLSDTNGNVLAERLLSEPFVWDYLCFFPDPWPCLPPTWRYGRFGLSPGYVTWNDLHTIDISTVPDGIYVLTITLDPLGLWGVWDQVAVWVEVRANQVRPL